MKSGRHILCSILLTLYKWALAEEEVTPYHVDAMNHMFTLPGWAIMREHDGFMIVVRGTEGGTAESVLSAKDIMETDGADGRIVTAENAATKIRHVHQLLSCQYASNLRVCYNYNMAAIRRCRKLRKITKIPECICLFLYMIKKIDEIVVRMQATLSCINEVFPITTYNKDVSDTMDDFKRFYDNSYYDSTSTDRNYQDAIMNSHSRNMNIALRSLDKFYNGFCRPNKDDSIVRIKISVQELDEKYRRKPFAVIPQIKHRLDLVVNANIEDYDAASVGFEYDTVQQTSRLTYQP